MLGVSMHTKHFFAGLMLLLSLATAAQSAQAEPPTNTLMHDEIEHIVIVMLENRSFDNVLAWLYDQNNPPNKFIPDETVHEYLGLTEETLDMYTNELKNSSGKIVFSSPPIKGVPSVAGRPFFDSPRFDPHEGFPDVTKQIFGYDGSNEPNMSGFLQNYATLWSERLWEKYATDIRSVMETYTKEELPTMYALGQKYAVSDLWFSSVPTQTNPNRAFTFCGTSDGETVNGVLGTDHFQSHTLWNRLWEQSPQTTWKIFWQSDMLPGAIHGPYSGTNIFAKMGDIPHLNDHFQTIDLFHALARNGNLPNVCFIEPQWTLCTNLYPTTFLEKKPQYHHFAIEAGQSNNEDFLVGFHGNDMHPPGDIRSGEDFVANIYTSLTANADAWNKTLLIITFDEHGGLFDHVPPPTAVPPDSYNQHGFNFDRYGVRVPTLFISPRIEQGTVIRSDDPAAPFDHTSLIASVLKWKDVDKEKWDLGKRVQGAPTIENVVTLQNPRQDAVLKPDQLILPQSDDSDVVQMNTGFYLKDKAENYVIYSKNALDQYAVIGQAERKMALEFVGGSGKITHGSFVLIKANDPSLSTQNILENTQLGGSCRYRENTHTTGQWWTVKSVDNPYVGAEIRYGDRIYLESQVYMNPLQFVAARMTHKEGLTNFFLIAEEITSQNSQDNYWIIEK